MNRRGERVLRAGFSDGLGLEEQKIRFQMISNML